MKKLIPGILGIFTAGGMLLATAGARSATPEACHNGSPELIIGKGDMKVSAVQWLKGERQVGKMTFPTRAGASLIIPAEKGMSLPVVQRVVGCQLARGEDANHPLSIKGVTAHVRTIPGAFVVDVTAPTDQVDAVMKAAQALVLRSAGGTNVASN